MRKKWMSSTLALVLAGTTVASMMPAVPVSAKGAAAASGTIMLIQKKEKIATQELQKAKHFRHWIR